jgi:hypothetical protein
MGRRETRYPERRKTGENQTALSDDQSQLVMLNNQVAVARQQLLDFIEGIDKSG